MLIFHYIISIQQTFVYTCIQFNTGPMALITGGVPTQRSPSTYCPLVFSYRLASCLHGIEIFIIPGIFS